MLSTHHPRSTPSWLMDILLLAALIGAFYAIWIGSHALFTPDEGRYSEVAREMVVTGDYITPRVNGVVFLDKPILYYWLQASAIKLFGVKEWAIRLWPALIGLLGCCITYIAGRTLFNRRTGILSTLILATSPLYYGAAHYANLDLEVAVFISGALLSFLIALKIPEQRRIRFPLLILAYFFASLAMLTKGLIGIVFPLMIIGVWILLLNKWTLLKKIHFKTGLILFFAITLPWFFLVQKANPEFFHFFFVTQQVSRFLTTADFNNKTPVWFYAPIVLAGFFPWSVFIFQAVFRHLRNVLYRYREHTTELFLLLWLVIIFTFFSIPRSKTIGYILPIFPTLALLTGSYLSTFWQNARSRLPSGLFFYLILSAACAVSFFIAPHLKFIEIEKHFIHYLTEMGIVFLISCIVSVYYYRQKNLSALFYCLLGTAAAFLLILSASTKVINEKSVKPLALQLKHCAKSDDEIITYYKYYQDLPIYLEKRVMIVADWDAPDIPNNDNWVRELWYGMHDHNTQDWLISEKTFWEHWQSQKRLFVLMNENYFADFSKKANSPVYKLNQHNDVILVTNR